MNAGLSKFLKSATFGVAALGLEGKIRAGSIRDAGSADYERGGKTGLSFSRAVRRKNAGRLRRRAER